ncbi:MAG: hypothetical protein ACI8P7_001563, partial [Candidatus Azotimanducaceae bacterium]
SLFTKDNPIPNIITTSAAAKKSVPLSMWFNFLSMYKKSKGHL